MARIYLAKAGGIGAFERYVVLKTISPDRANDQRFVTMFLDEARLAATLNHQNIAQVYEVDEADGNLFITMEYVHGENLRHILEATLRKGWTIPVELAVMIVSSAAAGLHHAHERKGKAGQPLNIVHRDVSPANIMVGYDGSVKLLDFGIAKAEERSTKTQQGTIKGKYGYMSPEQCRGKPIDRRSDIFALGIVLYEITTLRRAFRGNDDFDTMKRIVNGDLVPPSVAVPGYPRELEAIVLTAMARDPDFRFQTTQELLEALDAFMVRAKMSGSPSAMARFMSQLFGSKREPWVELDPRTKSASEPPGDRTDITVETPNESDSTAEATAVLDQHMRASGDRGAVAQDAATTQPTRAIGEPLGPEVAPRPSVTTAEPDDVAAWNQLKPATVRASGPTPADFLLVNQPTERSERATDRPPNRAMRPTERGQGSETKPPMLLTIDMIAGVRPAPPTVVPYPTEPVPSLRPSRAKMWILIAVVVAVIAIVAGSIAVGLMTTPTTRTRRTSELGPPEVEPTSSPAATGVGASFPAIWPRRLARAPVGTAAASTATS
jgi:serine/threonine-protein kinase